MNVHSQIVLADWLPIATHFELAETEVIAAFRLPYGLPWLPELVDIPKTLFFAGSLEIQLLVASAFGTRLDGP